MANPAAVSARTLVCSRRSVRMNARKIIPHPHLHRQQEGQASNAPASTGALNVTFVAGIAALGGLLFGYDTGVISGAELYLVKAFKLTSTTEEIAVSAVLVG